MIQGRFRGKTCSQKLFIFTNVVAGKLFLYFFAGKHFHGSFRSQNYSREFSREDIFVEDRKHAFQNWFRKPQNKNIFKRIDPVDSFTGTVHGKFEDVNAHGNLLGHNV